MSDCGYSKTGYISRVVARWAEINTNGASNSSNEIHTLNLYVEEIKTPYVTDDESIEGDGVRSSIMKKGGSVDHKNSSVRDDLKKDLPEGKPVMTLVKEKDRTKSDLIGKYDH